MENLINLNTKRHVKHGLDGTYIKRKKSKETSAWAKSSCIRKENNGIHVLKIPKNENSKMEFRFTEKKEKKLMYRQNFSESNSMKTENNCIDILKYLEVKTLKLHNIQNLLEQKLLSFVRKFFQRT